jgi:hypothetical protein
VLSFIRPHRCAADRSTSFGEIRNDCYCEGLQTPADRERRGAARAGVGKPPGNEPAGTRRRVWRAVYGDLGEADDLA